MFAASVFLLFASFLVSTNAYGEKYDGPQIANVDCSKFPQPLSWHVHITYMLTNDQQIADAASFRDDATKYFAPFLGADPVCPGTKLEPSGRYGKLKKLLSSLAF
jgi:hypothetical protein